MVTGRGYAVFLSCKWWQVMLSDRFSLWETMLNGSGPRSLYYLRTHLLRMSRKKRTATSQHSKPSAQRTSQRLPLSTVTVHGSQS